MPRVRGARPEDFDRISAVADAWWGRPIAIHLPRLWLDHFFATSRVVEDEAGLAAFLVAFVSPSRPDVAYIHFVGVRPDLRRSGLARALYEDFFERARRAGCHEVRAVTSPVNDGSKRFHARMGFSTEEVADYDGPGRPMTVFKKVLVGIEEPGGS